MTGISKNVKIFCRMNEYGEVIKVIEYNLVQFCEWYERAKERNARIIPNGMTGMIVITETRYFVVEVM